MYVVQAGIEAVVMLCMRMATDLGRQQVRSRCNLTVGGFQNVRTSRTSRKYVLLYVLLKAIYSMRCAMPASSGGMTGIQPRIADTDVHVL